MNKLTEPIYIKKPWGHEIMWALTDHYMAKTIEVDAFKVSNLVVYERKEKSIIVISGTLVIGMGPCCSEEDIEYTEYPTGWRFYIPHGKMHAYGATDVPVRLIEVSSPELDEGIVIPDSVDIGGVRYEI